MRICIYASLVGHNHAGGSRSPGHAVPLALVQLVVAPPELGGVPNVDCLETVSSHRNVFHPNACRACLKHPLQLCADSRKFCIKSIVTLLLQSNGRLCLLLFPFLFFELNIFYGFDAAKRRFRDPSHGCCLRAVGGQRKHPQGASFLHSIWFHL